MTDLRGKQESVAGQGAPFESTILVERVASADLLKRWTGQRWVQALAYRPGLKVTLRPSSDELMETSDWNWHEFTFMALTGHDKASAVELELHVWALTPPKDAWTEEELGNVLVVIIEGMKGLPVEVLPSAGWQAAGGAVQ